MIEQVFYLSFVVTSISFAVTVTSIFKPLREWLSKLHPKVEELIHCPFCFGFWVTVVVVGYVEYRSMDLLPMILEVFAVLGVTAVLHYPVLRAYEPIHKMLMQRQIEKLKREKSNGTHST